MPGPHCAPGSAVPCRPSARRRSFCSYRGHRPWPGPRPRVWLGRDPAPIGIAPDGQHPADYLVLLTVFGLTLVAARTALVRAPLWAAVGTHLTFLTVNRIVLEGDRRGAGWHIEQTTPDAVLLVPAYLLVATAGFAVCRRAVRRRGAEPPRAVAERPEPRARR
ncbi:hypothetical protein ACFQ10_07215 [Streptomyces indonesiensis]